MALTERQLAVLADATRTTPVYGERPSLTAAQMPIGMRCFNLRTIQSLEARGYLIADDRGAYLLTEAGAGARKAAIGF